MGGKEQEVAVDFLNSSTAPQNGKAGDDLLSHTRVARAPPPARPVPRQDSIFPQIFTSPCSHVTDKDH